MTHNLDYRAICILWFISSVALKATVIHATPADYSGYLGALTAGDTLLLAPGTYTGNLVLNGRNGTSANPIVIIGSGNTTNFQGQSCCNTVSITRCSYLIIGNLQLDGQNQEVDAVKAEGTAGNWAHHIILERLNIINYGSSQQNVGISTKCPAWDWIIRNNRIIGAGTGMYLGNSDGTKPFVNGVIEYNYVANTVGYNIEIKHQINGQRELLPETSVNGKTIIRHNVFTKDGSSSTGANARPNLLVGGFPLTGWGSTDYYEIYGNFFYNNPVEALFQGTGNIMLYGNIFVNHYDPPGFRAVYITPQNGVSPQDIRVFHNTVWTVNSSGGIRLLGPNAGYRQYCCGNAVFSPSPITNFSDSLDNITDTYANAGKYVLAATEGIAMLNLYPKSGELAGTLTPSALFQGMTGYDRDFNGDIYNWTYRGAYSGCCLNNGWKLQLDTMPAPGTASSVVTGTEEVRAELCPNPVRTLLSVKLPYPVPSEIILIAISGEQVLYSRTSSRVSVMDVSGCPGGVYYLVIRNAHGVIAREIIKE